MVYLSLPHFAKARGVPSKIHYHSRVHVGRKAHPESGYCQSRSRFEYAAPKQMAFSLAGSENALWETGLATI